MNPKNQRLRAVVVIALVAIVPFSAAAIDLTVEYVDGYLDLRDDGEWIEVYVGDVISDQATIRLDEDSIAELYAPGVKLTLTKPGIYEVTSLLDASGEQRSAGIASMVGGKVASLFTEKKSDAQAAVMGVRGAKSESEVQWMTGDTAELIAAGKTSLEEGDLVSALESFQEAYDFAEIDEETEVLFYLAYTAYVMGEVREAADYLGDIIDVDDEAEFFPNLYLLNGQVLAETFAFEDAVSWLEAYRTAATIDESVLQTALLLEGVSYKAMKQIDNAKNAFDAARKIDPSSDVGQTASTLLEGIE